MQAADAIKLIATTALWSLATAAFAHEKAAWAAIHWHLSDVAGIATVAGLSGAALWLARRQKRGAKT